MLGFAAGAPTRARVDAVLCKLRAGQVAMGFREAILPNPCLNENAHRAAGSCDPRNTGCIAKAPHGSAGNVRRSG